MNIVLMIIFSITIVIDIVSEIYINIYIKKQLDAINVGLSYHRNWIETIASKTHVYSEDVVNYIKKYKKD